jgi:hypothetical protein
MTNKRERASTTRVLTDPPVSSKTVSWEQPPDLGPAFRLPTELSADFFKGGRRQPRLDRREL